MKEAEQYDPIKKKKSMTIKLKMKKMTEPADKNVKTAL